MLEKKAFPKWLKDHGLSYDPVSVDDFYVGAELLVVDLRRPLDPQTSLYAQASVIRIEEVRENGMIYYRHHPHGRERCFVLVKNFLFHETSVVVKSLSFAEVVQLKTASQ